MELRFEKSTERALALIVPDLQSVAVAPAAETTADAVNKRRLRS
jgi:hypothetical protein